LVLISLIILLVYFQFLLKPRVKSLFLVSSEVKQTFKELSQAKEDIANIPKFKKKIEEFKGKISFYEKKMPTQKEIPALLGELSRFAQDTKVKILGILPLEKLEESRTEKKDKRKSLKEPYFEVPIRIEAKAAYHNLGFFINKLEMADRFMKISDIQIKSNPNTNKLHNVRLIVSTYVLFGEKGQQGR
jgi:Tfp pilus assembly protein PilO